MPSLALASNQDSLSAGSERKEERVRQMADGDGWFFVLFCWVLFGHMAACAVLVP